MAEKLLITTAIDYVNDVIHIGHAYQKILADALARFHRQIGHEVFFLTGTDEHGSKTETTAEARGIAPADLADKVSAADQKQLDALNLSYNRFIRTTDTDHREIVTDFWQRSFDNGNIYLGSYTGIYCVGCEEFLKEKDLVGGRCPNHPRQKPQALTEENYFFKWSRYQGFLHDYLQTHPDFIQPQSRRSEMLSFLESGIEDIPVSRPSVGFGIPVPNDPNHVIYVWFDALINYITGKPEAWENEATQIVHILGKDNVRWHSLLWPAMLKSAGYRLPNVVYGHDFLTLNGQKISKSLGNIIRPAQLVEQFGADAVRYFFLRYGPLRNDVDVTINRIREVYNADLANGLGNLSARIAAMAARANVKCQMSNVKIEEVGEFKQFDRYLVNLRVDLALELIWQKIAKADRFIDYNRVWEQRGQEQEESLKHLVQEIREVSMLLEPFLPETAEKIQKRFRGPKIASGAPLFPRIT